MYFYTLINSCSNKQTKQIGYFYAEMSQCQTLIDWSFAERALWKKAIWWSKKRYSWGEERPVVYSKNVMTHYTLKINRGGEKGNMSCPKTSRDADDGDSDIPVKHTWKGPLNMPRLSAKWSQWHVCVCIRLQSGMSSGHVGYRELRARGDFTTHNP